MRVLFEYIESVPKIEIMLGEQSFEAVQNINCLSSTGFANAIRNECSYDSV